MAKLYTIIRRFLFPFELVGILLEMEMTNLLFVSSVLYLNILKTEGLLQFWDKETLDVRGSTG